MEKIHFLGKGGIVYETQRSKNQGDLNLISYDLFVKFVGLWQFPYMTLIEQLKDQITKKV